MALARITTVLLTGANCDTLCLVGKLPDEQCLCKNLVEIGILVDQQLDRQWEWLARLSHEGEARPDQSASRPDLRQQEITGSTGDDHALFVKIRPDPEREQRKGVPEVIFGETKEPAQIVAMAQILLSKTGRAIVSRVRPETVATLQAAFPGSTVSVHDAARAMVIYRPDYVRRNTGGLVGVISAGTSDVPAAEEAALIAEEMGC